MKDIYIILTMTGTHFSRLLRLVTQEEFTHVSIALDKDLEKLYSFGRRNMLIPLIAGFVKEGVETGIYAKYEVSCEIYKLTITDKQYKRLQHEIEKYIKNYPHYRYNLAGLPFMWLGITFERQKHLVCSQFVAQVLEKSKIYKFKQGWALTKPMDVVTIQGLKKIYKGRLQDYKEQKEQDVYGKNTQFERQQKDRKFNL